MSKPRIPRGWAKEIKKIEKLTDLAGATTIEEMLSAHADSPSSRKRKQPEPLEQETSPATPDKPPSPHPDDVRAALPPRVILFRKQTTVLSSAGPMSHLGTGSAFAEINALLKMRNDARTEAHDSLPKRM